MEEGTDSKNDLNEVGITEDRYIVVFNNDAFDDAKTFGKRYAQSQEIILDDAQKLLEQGGLTNIKIRQVFSNSIKGVSMNLDEEQLNKLENDRNIKYIEKDRYVLLAPPCGTKKGGPCEDNEPQGQDIPYGVVRVGGVQNYSGTGVAWIIDSGIDIDHPDLNVDHERGYRAPEVAPFLLEHPFDDDNGHGTHVAGIIGAINNDIGVLGVAPGATVIPVKVLGENGYGWWSDIIAGIDYVAANAKPGDVANLSIGGVTVDAVDDAVIAASGKGIWFVIAAGNNADDANLYSPSRTNGDLIITISAMDENDQWASFSNFGNPPIDYVAPGVMINSTSTNGTYRLNSGTSMAAPHAAGVILLGGTPGTDGSFVNGDPDGNPDKVIYYYSETNALPVVNFDYSADLLQVQFTDQSSDSDGEVISWSWEFGDGNSSSSQHPSHTYTNAGSFNVSLTVTDDAGETASTSKSIEVTAEEPEPGNIVLSANASKVRGRWTTDLTWTPSGSSSQVDIYREGNLIATIDNSGTYTDNTDFRGGGSLVYKVCEAGTDTCSNEITVQF